MAEDRLKITPSPQQNLDGYIQPPSPEGMESPTGKMVEQLGTSPKKMAQGEFDIRLFSVLEEKDIPLLIYAKIRGKKSSTWRTIGDDYPHLKVSIGGRGRRDAIRGEAVQRGGVATVEPEIPQPGWIQRNFTDRGWRKKAEENQM